MDSHKNKFYELLDEKSTNYKNEDKITFVSQMKNINGFFLPYGYKKEKLLVTVYALKHGQ